MIIISHRANINGPSENENSPESIEIALNLNFDVELDVWAINDQLMLGHDSPQYALNKPLVDHIGTKGWFHCKNIEALYYFSNNHPELNYFWHQSDDYTITSKGYFWTYPGKKISNKSVIVLPELIDSEILGSMLEQGPYALCTDWPINYGN